MRLVQIVRGVERRVAAVQESHLALLNTAMPTIYHLASRAVQNGEELVTLVGNAHSGETLDYGAVYAGTSEWRLLPSFDHPHDPARCMVSGTGLTHKKSAENRASMHKGTAAAEVTDSMRMYRMGMEGGTPEPGKIGAQPEWFYKGDGSILKAHGEALETPPYADDGGEEPEIAGVYLISPAGEPWRIGFTVTNEFSDHKMEKKNYLYLAHSKLRNCAIGPELNVGGVSFEDVPGTVAILREGQPLWRKEIWSGQRNMCHSLANLEHHHFKYKTHRRPGDVHIHVFGADAFSFGDGLALAEGDVMEVSFPQFGSPLRNPLKICAPLEAPVSVKVLS